MRSVRWVLTAALLAVLTLGGCTLRIETPVPGALVPSELETVRDTQAAQTRALIDIATRVMRALPWQDPARKTVQTIVAGATAHLVNLGGVYESGMPPALAPPKPNVATYTGTDLAALMDALVASHGIAFEAATTTTDASFRSLMTSITMWRALTTAQLAKVSTVTNPALVSTAWASLEAGVPDPAALVTALDSLGYGFEVYAARTGDNERTRAETTASQLRQLANKVAAANQVGARVPDTRLAAYPLPAVDFTNATSAHAQAATWFQDLVATAKSLLASASGRGWLISLATWAESERLAWSDQALAPLP